MLPRVGSLRDSRLAHVVAGVVVGFVLASGLVAVPDAGPVDGTALALATAVALAVTFCDCRLLTGGCGTGDCECC